jgi:aminopeptidase-like protein
VLLLNFDYYDFVKRYYKLNRATVTDEIAEFIGKIKEIFPEAKIIKARSGAEYFTWVIPQSWDVKGGHLKDSSGKTIVDYKNNPLHLIQYSNSFEGTISYKQLKGHLYYSKDNPSDIPYIYRKQYNYNKDDSWGLCIPYKTFKRLRKNTKYSVKIDASFANKEMHVFDYLIEGEKQETIFFAAHSCHPAQVNDGIGNVALLIDLFLWLKSKGKPRYTYRLIVGPEYFAAPVVLSEAEKVQNLRYGFYLDMMVHKGPLGYSSSYSGDSLADYMVNDLLRKRKKPFKNYPYRELWGNDELFYDGPDFNIPTIGLGRSNFKHYHLSSDDLSTLDKKSYEESLKFLKDIVNSFESDRIIKRRYRGPLYLSRYNYYIDPKVDLDGYQNLQKIQILLDGTTSTLQISRKLGIEIDFVNRFVDHLIKLGLAEIVG